MADQESFISMARFVGLDGVRKSSIDLALAYCGIQRCSPLHNNGPEIRETHFIHIIESGWGVLRMNGKIHRLTGGQAFLIPAGVSAHYTADLHDPWAYMWVGFSGVMAEESMALAGFSLHQPVREVGNTAQLKADIEGMLERYQHNFSTELRRNGHFFQFIAHLIEEYQAQGNSSTDSTQLMAQHARTAYHFIMNNYYKPIKVSDVADDLGISRNYLFTCFKEVYGVSPKEFLTTVRMDNAVSMLMVKSLNVTQVAHSVGFSDVLAFSKCFKEYHQVSPSVFKKQLRGRGEKI